MSLKKLLPILFVVISFTAKANYMLVQNVTKLGNNPTNKTIQIQFDLSWQNSWRDDINWDAAWIFIKFKGANGLWQHARLNLSGFANGAGTSNTIKVGSDSVGAFVYRSALGSGNFNATSMQLQWNYGASGLTDGSGLEVRVFATEMVYVPEGDFTIPPTFYDATYNYSSQNYNNPDYFFISPDIYNSRDQNVVINSRLTPKIQYLTGKTFGTIYYDPANPSWGSYEGEIISDSVSFRIKGNVGIDFNNDGIVENTTYPIGFKSFYCYKYELSQGQLIDFVNLITPTQRDSIGIPYIQDVFTNNGQYFTRTPNKACAFAKENIVLAYAIWSGVRPMTILEFNKASYGPKLPVLYTGNSYVLLNNPNTGGYENAPISGYHAWGDATSASMPLNVYNFYSDGLANVGSMANTNTIRTNSGASYYGVMDLTGNATEPVVKLTNFNFSNQNGKGTLPANGNPFIISNWVSGMLLFIDQVAAITNFKRIADASTYNSARINGFRYVRSAE